MGTRLGAVVARMGAAVLAARVVTGLLPIVMVARRTTSLPTLPAQVRMTSHHRTPLAPPPTLGKGGRPRHTHRGLARATEVRIIALAAMVVGVELDLGEVRCPSGRGIGTMTSS